MERHRRVASVLGALTLFGHAILAPTLCHSFTRQLSASVAPGDRAEIGRSFNQLSFDLGPHIVKTVDPSKYTRTEIRDVDVFIKYVVNSSELEASLRANGRASASGAFAELQSSFDFGAEHSRYSNSAMLYIEMHGITHRHTLPPSHLSEDAARILHPAFPDKSKKNVAAFYARYGTHFVNGAVYGWSISLTYSLENETVQSKTHFENTYKASAGFGPLTASAEGQIKGSLQMLTSGSNQSLSIKARGDLSTFPVDISGSDGGLKIIEEAARWGLGDVVTSESARPVAYLLEPVSILADFAAGGPPEVSVAALSWLSGAEGTLKTIDRMTLFGGLSSAAQGYLNDLRSSIVLNQNQLAEGYLAACAQPTPVPYSPMLTSEPYIDARRLLPAGTQLPNDPGGSLTDHLDIVASSYDDWKGGRRQSPSIQRRVFVTARGGTGLWNIKGYVLETIHTLEPTLGDLAQLPYLETWSLIPPDHDDARGYGRRTRYAVCGGVGKKPKLVCSVETTAGALSSPACDQKAIKSFRYAHPTSSIHEATVVDMGGGAVWFYDRYVSPMSGGTP